MDWITVSTPADGSEVDVSHEENLEKVDVFRSTAVILSVLNSYIKVN